MIVLVIVFLFYGCLSDIGRFLDQNNASFEERTKVAGIIIAVIFVICMLFGLVVS